MSTTEQKTAAEPATWADTVTLYLQARVIVMFFLGFSSGLPFLLIFSTLSAWLTEAGVTRTTIGFFSWIGMMFSIKVFWAPVVDRVALPALTRAVGKRRSWMLVAQVCIVVGLVGVALTDPSTNLTQTALFCLLLAFAAATQDIAIDAYRIESAPRELQAALAATYQVGYRVALIVAGAGALYLAEYVSWPAAYLVMAACVGVGFVTVLVVPEPDAPKDQRVLRREADLARSFQADSRHALRFFAILYGIATAIAATLLFNLGPFEVASAGDWLTIAGSVLVVEAVVLCLLWAVGWWPAVTLWVSGAVVSPFDDFFKRMGMVGAVILLFISVYRISDIVMGIMANPFYLDLGFTKAEIATVSKFFGVFMILIGGFAGASFVARFGIMRAVLLGAILVATTNLLFAWLAEAGPVLGYLYVTIGADNLSAGFAGTAFIAYLSSLTNTAYTATQYALFSSLFTLAGKYIGGFSGKMVEGLGYTEFFVVAAALGIPAILLTLFLMRYGPRTETEPARLAPAPRPAAGE